jgi:hypothetical protein
MSCGGCSRLKPSVEQRAIAEILARLEILPDHGLRAGNDAREQLRPFALLQPLHARLDGLAQKGGALLHLPLDRLAVETHLRRRASGRVLSPVQASARARRPVPVQGLHVIRIAPQILALRPEHGIVDMETDGHIGLEGQSNAKLNELGVSASP